MRPSLTLETESQRKILQNAVLLNDWNTAMLYLSSWLHQPFLNLERIIQRIFLGGQKCITVLCGLL